MTQTNTSMAERAAAIYDADGEEAMLRFANEQQEPLNQPDMAGTALMVLQDHTVIRSSDSGYVLCWTERTRNGPVERNEERGASVPTDQRFSRRIREQPVFDWPNGHTVLQRALFRLELETAYEMTGEDPELDYEPDMGDDTVLEQGILLNSVPGLHEAVSEALHNQDGDDPTMNMLDFEEGCAADRLEEALTKEIKDQLKAMTRAAILKLVRENG